ncbi:hypothetical protein FTO70_16760 [Methanosarcina sp. KYL-1]|uniref:hypothetical protein n=1 Tax=Methanosarcina sp. KYL-1 TaxID=2602068 RepID=UPI0021013864|nr:hypothetical protein [Methanosarcina sp. KYL-1]MCQ1537292.1 hypothetical protein [Methanosarcina sp. KYL-1]
MDPESEILLMKIDEIKKRFDTIDARLDKMEQALERINGILKKVEENTYFGCYVQSEQLE